MYSFKTYLPYYKRNLKVALPVMLTQLGASLVGFFDSMMVGHYATVDLAAVSFANAIFFTVMVFAMGALMGITPLVGIQVGSQHTSSPIANSPSPIAPTCSNCRLCLDACPTGALRNDMWDARQCIAYTTHYCLECQHVCPYNQTTPN